MRLCRLGSRRQEVETDLLELFDLRHAQRGRAFANRQYVADALSLWKWRPAEAMPAPRQRYGGFGAMKQDIIFAARLFRRRPGLFGLTVIGLGVAIGISTAVFSIVRAVAFGGYGVSGPESVFRVALEGGPFTRTTGNSPYQGNWAFSDYARLKEGTTSSVAVAAVTVPAEFRADRDHGDSHPAGVMAVSGDYFSVLGFRASLGRTLTAADDMPGLSHVVVSHGFWKNRLGSDPAIVGRTIWLDNHLFTVIGVADRKHSSPGPAAPAFWTTLASHRDMWIGQSRMTLDDTQSRLRAARNNSGGRQADRELRQQLEADLSAPPPQWNPAVDVFCRPKPGITRAQAESEVRAIVAALTGDRGVTHRPGVKLESLDEYQRDSILLAAILMTIIGLVVFLACANITNLLLASAATRSREIGTRLAIGASRARIVRQLMTESLLLGLVGGALGLMIAAQVLPLFAALVQVPPAFDVSPDPFVYLFVAIVTTAVGIIAGLAPARYGRRGDLASALKTDQHTAPRLAPRGFMRSLLIGGQAGVSIVLLVVAALLTRSLVRTAGFDLGYDAGRLITVSIGTGTNGRAWSPARTAAYWRAGLDRVRQLPGVAAASLASVPPFDRGSASQILNGHRINRNDTSPEYFATLGARLVRGRIYTAEEITTQAPVAVISASLAREFWGASDPLGASLERVWGPDDAPGAPPAGLLRKPKSTRIVGVVTDVITGLKNHDAPVIYLPVADTSSSRLVVRAHDDPHLVVRSVRDALEAIDPSVEPSAWFPLDGLEREREGPKILATLAGLIGMTALGLAAIGLFGVTAFTVEQRTHEVSVRRALGASNAQLMRMLFGESLTPVCIGLTCGLVLALLGGRAIQSVLYGVSSRDPFAIVAAIAILLGAAGAAVFFPARRATRVDPAELLKMV